MLHLILLVVAKGIAVPDSPILVFQPDVDSCPATRMLPIPLVAREGS